MHVHRPHRPQNVRASAPADRIPRGAVPARGHHLYRLQRTLGNSVVSRLVRPPVQRTVTIMNYNTKQGGVAENQVLDIGRVRTAITGAVTDQGDRTTVLATLTTLDSQNHQAPDVAVLATTLSAGTKKVATQSQGAEAVGSTLLNTNRTEAPLWERLITRSGTLSRAMGTPGSITLNGLEAALGVTVGNIQQGVLAIDTALRNPPKKLEATEFDGWVQELAGNLNIRTAHENGAGWLPAGNVPGTFPALQGRVNTARTGATIANLVTNGTMTALQADYRAVRTALNPEERRYFGWCSHGGPVSPYIEVGVPGEKDGRVVFDIERRLFFFTVHYNWHKGYNPFLQIT